MAEITVYWTGASGGDWDVPGNWVDIDTELPPAAAPGSTADTWHVYFVDPIPLTIPAAPSGNFTTGPVAGVTIDTLSRLVPYATVSTALNTLNNVTATGDVVVEDDNLDIATVGGDLVVVGMTIDPLVQVTTVLGSCYYDGLGTQGVDFTGILGDLVINFGAPNGGTVGGTLTAETCIINTGTFNNAILTNCDFATCTATFNGTVEINGVDVDGGTFNGPTTMNINSGTIGSVAAPQANDVLNITGSVFVVALDADDPASVVNLYGGEITDANIATLNVYSPTIMVSLTGGAVDTCNFWSNVKVDYTFLVGTTTAHIMARDIQLESGGPGFPLPSCELIPYAPPTAGGYVSQTDIG